VSTRTEYSITDVLSPQELQKLGSPDLVRERPDAEVVEWDGVSAVTAPATSIASSMDRFMAGRTTAAQENTLEGFYSEFTENDEKVVFVDKELRKLLGDQAVARIDNFEDSYAVAVRSPEEVQDVVERYDQNYAGNVEEFFWDQIQANHAVMPVLYTSAGVVPETAVSLMEGDGILQGEDGSTADELLSQELEGQMDPDSLNITRYEAPEASEAEYFVDVMLPQGYDEADHEIRRNSLIVEADEQKAMESMPEVNEVLDYEENNGVYTVEIK
jgi:hypothetical protein